MSAEVLAFPGSTLLPHTPLRRYRLRDLILICGLEAYEPRTQLAKLRQLVTLDGLPLPVTRRVWKNAPCRGADAICSRSQWDAAAVDAWAHRPPQPGAPGAAADLPPLSAGLHRHLAQRARQLAAGAAQ